MRFLSCVFLALFLIIGSSHVVHANQIPQPQSVSPRYLYTKVDLPETISETISTVYSDSDGSSDISECYLLIHRYIRKSHGFYAYYDAAQDKLYLRDMYNYRWLGGYEPGSNNSIETYYVKLHCDKTFVNKTGNNVTVKWTITFKNSRFARSNSQVKCFLQAKDFQGAASAWSYLGRVFFTPNPNTNPDKPQAVSLSPNNLDAITGNYYYFTTTYSDPAGASNLRRCDIIVNTGLSFYNGIFAYYNQQVNKIFLRDDQTGRYLGGVEPGSDSPLIENSYCVIDPKRTTLNSRMPLRAGRSSILAQRTTAIFLQATGVLGL